MLNQLSNSTTERKREYLIHSNAMGDLEEETIYNFTNLFIAYQRIYRKEESMIVVQSCYCLKIISMAYWNK
ncbi:hypothetical protein T4D_10776 [Trichinella pseudospiralis]|uniref:Uncharacterized protein n=1 Tax=Trichinella pseudospiralis TaxID=6337 RepID=A0A0V1FX93_TRIPS|nr:hypothetical protein T4D_10776 [Trichinella pseudospiralis]